MDTISSSLVLGYDGLRLVTFTLVIWWKCQDLTYKVIFMAMSLPRATTEKMAVSVIDNPSFLNT